jgi:hypothetical protein
VEWFSLIKSYAALVLYKSKIFRNEIKVA